MKKIYLFIILLAISCFSLPGRASALAMQVTVHVASLKIPQRGIILDPSIAPPATDLDFALYGVNGSGAFLAIWQDATQQTSGATNELKRYYGPYEYHAGMGKSASTTSVLAAATSTTSISIPAAPVNKTFVVPTCSTYLANVAGFRARAASRANNGNWMEGYVKYCSGNSLSIDVDSYAGSGTFTDWDVTFYLSVPNFSLGSTASRTFALSWVPSPPYSLGSRVTISKNSDNRNWMEGYVTSYSDTSVTVNIDTYGGSGYLTGSDSWDIFPSHLLLTPPAPGTFFKNSVFSTGSLSSYPPGTYLLAGDVYNNQGILIAPGSDATVNFNYSTSGNHNYSAYIGLYSNSCTNSPVPMADCTYPAVTAGNRTCSYWNLQVVNAETMASTATITWHNAYCPNIVTSYAVSYLGQNTTTYPTDDTNFYIFLKQLYP